MTVDDTHRYMRACLRMARRHRGLTATNPSVGTLLLRNGVVVGRGITATGGRPHAETVAIEQAGNRAKGSEAFVSLEPCAHHGATPPCAQALIDAGINKVHTAWLDPDDRVNGKGHAMLEAAGISVETGQGAQIAMHDLAYYLTRKQLGRPYVTLKLALSADNKLGRPGEEIAITGPLAKNYVHRMRAEHDAILVGRETAMVDDPQLTCRLPGLEARSPERYILDSDLQLSPHSLLASMANQVPTYLVSPKAGLPDGLSQTGVRLFKAERHGDGLALPELLEDIASMGRSSLMVEGGAKVARSFLQADLVDEIVLIQSPLTIGDGGISSPIDTNRITNAHALSRRFSLGEDMVQIFKRA